MKLASIELRLPHIAAARDYLLNVWGLADAGSADNAAWLRGSGDLPYLVGLAEADARSVASVTFHADAAALAAVRNRVAASGRPWRAVESGGPGGGAGFELELPDGEIFRFLAGTASAAPLPGSDLPNRLTHVVLNATDAEASARFCEEVLGFRVSDRTKGMVFVRCNRSHHAIAFARAGYGSLNHIAFEMADTDAVMRGIGRLRDAAVQPVWGPGRHGPGNNVFAYFIAPFGAVVEFSTPTNEVDESYPTGTPDDWTWPENRIDQWGVSAKDFDAIGAAERNFRFRRAW